MTCLWPKAWNRSSNSLFVLDAVSQKAKVVILLASKPRNSLRGLRRLRAERLGSGYWINLGLIRARSERPRDLPHGALFLHRSAPRAFYPGGRGCSRIFPGVYYPNAGLTGICVCDVEMYTGELC